MILKYLLAEIKAVDLHVILGAVSQTAFAFGRAGEKPVHVFAHGQGRVSVWRVPAAPGNEYVHPFMKEQRWQGWRQACAGRRK